MVKRKSPYRPRVLLLEDEAFVALDLTVSLQGEGFDVLGPCRTVKEAKEAITSFWPDVAILDINLGEGKTSFEVTELLDAADIPFVFVTGYSKSIMPTPACMGYRPRLSKPVDIGRLTNELERLIG
jgi:CheY-like chemotaxis protein